ncbi:MAG: hypothetical protein ABIJ00_11020, partial [Candidatus Eisenbacteria bacterium]
DGVLLEIPFGLRDGFREIGDERSIQIFYQTVHHKKILGGVLSRPRREIFEFFMTEPVVSDFIKMQEDETWVPELPGPEDMEKFLGTFSPRYVLIHPEYRESRTGHFVEAMFSGHISDTKEVDGFLLMTIELPDTGH